MDTIIYDSVFDLLATQLERRPDAVAIEDRKSFSITYSELHERVLDVVKALRACGVGRGGRVAIVLPNGPELAISMLGVTCFAAAVPLNPVYRKEEYRAYFDEIGVDFLLTRSRFQTEARAVARERGLPVIELSDDGKMSVSHDLAAIPADWRSQMSRPDDTALILLTSGSTGRSKKVPLSQRNIFVSVADICRTLELTPQDACLCMWEQFHIGGLVDLLLVPLASGGRVICAGGFDAALYYDLLKARQPTWFQGVPTTLHELSVYAKRNFVDPRAAPLRLIRSVASSLSPQLMEEIEDLFGVPVVQTFGMTEAGPLITTNMLPPQTRKPGSVGISCGPEIRIVDPEGTDLPTGEIGEVVIRGGNVISGYEDAPEANAHSFRDGWFHTGDTGYLDEDRYLYLAGRLKEMINRGGEKITPQEIDDVLLTHPEIAQAASFSVKHRTLGEDVAAAIVLRSKDAVTENEVRNYVSRKLAGFKVPQKVVILDQMPRDPIGKINRLSLAVLTDASNEPRAAAGASNEFEERLSKIWATELGLRSVGLDDNFFAIGGDSLSGVRTILSVEETFNSQLPATVLVDHPTVRQMAGLLAHGEPADSRPKSGLGGMPRNTLSQSQVRLMAFVMGAGQIPVLQPGSTIKAANLDGRRKPLVWCFNSPEKEMSGLLPHLGSEQPLLGLFSGSRQLPNTDDAIDKIAGHYADQLVELYPDGQFSLGGNCKGARVTHRIVDILADRGMPIEHVCLLEYSDPRLFSYEGKLMLMFGKHSKHKAYRKMRWGSAGWKEQFARVPVTGWVTGRHGRFFRPQNAREIAFKLDCFLNDRPLPEKRFEKARDFAVMAIHKIKPIFICYVFAYKVRTFLRYGNQRKPRAAAIRQHG